MVQGKQKQKQSFVALGSGYLLKNKQNKVYLITIQYPYCSKNRKILDSTCEQEK